MDLPVIIGVCGGSGSGKTTFIKELKKHFETESVSFMSFDNYYRPRDQQEIDDEGVKNFDLPESMDIDAFLDDIVKLKDQQAVSRTEYVFNNETAVAKEIIVNPAQVIIIEGLFIYHYPKLRDQIDLKIFINVDDEVKIIRRIKRDKLERNYPLDDVLYRYKNHVIPSYKKYIQPYVGGVDLIINNNHSFVKGLLVIKAYLSSLLSKKKV